MNDDDFDELAGRIEGIGRALLLVVSALETRGIIDGPLTAETWRQELPAVHTPQLQTAHKTLQELAQALDDARSYRQSRSDPSGIPKTPAEKKPRRR